MKELLEQPATVVAQRLLGSILERTIDGNTVRVRIVETESYDQSDAASHSYKGRTPRTDIMFGPPGYLYVYFTYGMHYCCNIVTGKEGEGSAVLIRAVEPIDNEDVLWSYRNKRGVELTNGPAKLCQALNIDKQLNRHDLTLPPLKLIVTDAQPPDAITHTTRIGIREAKERPWRFYITDNKYVSVR